MELISNQEFILSKFMSLFIHSILNTLYCHLSLSRKFVTLKIFSSHIYSVSLDVFEKLFDNNNFFRNLIFFLSDLLLIRTDSFFDIIDRMMSWNCHSESLFWLNFIYLMFKWLMFYFYRWFSSICDGKRLLILHFHLLLFQCEDV